MAAVAEVRLSTCATDPALCPEATGLIHPHAPAIDSFFTFSGGGSVGDFNRDGRQDLFLVTGGEAPDRLYLNQGDGTFREVAEAAGVAELHRGHGSVVGDIDKDGWLDIFVTSLGPMADEWSMPGNHLLWLNQGGRPGGLLADGTPTFRNIAREARADMTSFEQPSGMGAALGDYDRDGDLDLLVVSWLTWAEGSLLLRNEGIHERTGLPRFSNATPRARLFKTEMHGLTAHIVDVDGDRWPEVLVAADYRTSRLYHNNGDGTFADVTREAQVGLDGNGMGSVLADVDNDGLLDWYVTSIWTNTPFEDATGHVPGTGNYLYRNLGGGAFDPGPRTRGPVARGGWGWGAVAADLDHDGLVDLITTNGWQAENGEGHQEWLEDPTSVFHNLRRCEVPGRRGRGRAGPPRRRPRHGALRLRRRRRPGPADRQQPRRADAGRQHGRHRLRQLAASGTEARRSTCRCRPTGSARWCASAPARHDADPPHRDRRRIPGLFRAQLPTSAWATRRSPTSCASSGLMAATRPPGTSRSTGACGWSAPPAARWT